MSAADRSGSASRNPLEELPRFDLDYLVDDEDDPAEVTVLPASGDHDISSTWITIDLSHAVPLDEIR